MKPLHSDWSPSWADNRDAIIDKAFDAREQLKPISAYRELGYNTDEPATCVVEIRGNHAGAFRELLLALPATPDKDRGPL